MTSSNPSSIVRTRGLLLSCHFVSSSAPLHSLLLFKNSHRLESEHLGQCSWENLASFSLKSARLSVPKQMHRGTWQRWCDNTKWVRICRSALLVCQEIVIADGEEGAVPFRGAGEGCSYRWFKMRCAKKDGPVMETVNCTVLSQHIDGESKSLTIIPGLGMRGWLLFLCGV